MTPPTPSFVPPCLRAFVPLSRHRGFTLAAMLIVLGLLGVFGLIATEVSRSSLQASRLAQESQTRAIRFDGLIAQLRQDAWNARSISVTPAAATLEQGGGGQVTWHWPDAQTLVRRFVPPAGPPSQQTWANLEAKLTFQARGPALRIAVQDGPMNRQDTLVLPSQILLAQRSLP